MAQAMNKRLEVSGELSLELDGYPIHLQAKNQQVLLTFSSFAALRRFYRFMQRKGLGLGILPPQHPFWDHIGHLHVICHLDESLIGEMGPEVKPTWWARYLGLDQLRVDTKLLWRSFWHHLFKKY